ncbi:MAG TPA: bifunctional demethylmenaquinone methyltransferase/2-methoxy-6-polyprenyl-1,4-benzoquinol methylase UbiE [Lutibacter sp.]|nr:bifunctional demethylmenaquinone methyltransferase/2-methoxy-6-polyprenyl-1,4-benzoquinol methylase UbiE [Lutibacter sp.]
MSKTIKPYSESNQSKKEQVTQMFDTISKEYDSINRIMTFGIDIKWRKKVINIIAQKNPKFILDIASGTGDLAILAAQKTKATNIIGADISEGMLAIGEKKITKLNLSDRIKMQVADSEDLPFSDNYFDAITVAFGVRNFENLDKGIQEIHRVLKPKGVFVVLETSIPKYPIIKQLYLLHSNILLPLFGKLFSKDPKAYTYLSKSAKKFPYGADFNNILNKNGFKEVRNLPQTMGVATIYIGNK